jgi:anti-sigma regulatory factor (Ser/Thr protein kinase)
MANPSQHDMTGLRRAAIVNGKLEIVLNNTIEAIEDGRRSMLEFLAGQRLADAVRHRLEVIFEELVSNTIRHGFTRHSRQSIHVRIEPRPGLVEFTFEDDGAPFNPLDVEAPERFSTVETAKVGGLGIPLVNRLSAHLRYERLTPRADDMDFAPCNRLVVGVAV